MEEYRKEVGEFIGIIERQVEVNIATWREMLRMRLDSHDTNLFYKTRVIEFQKELNGWQEEYLLTFKPQDASIDGSYLEEETSS